MSRPVILVHYHELGLKGHNRSTFERRLIRNIQAALATDGRAYKVSKTSGRILVDSATHAEDLDASEGLALVKRLAQLPGIARVSCGLRVSKDLEAIKQAAERVLGQVDTFDSFKVDARRANTNFPLDSMALNREVGAHLVQCFADKHVQMKAPDVRVRVEIIKNEAFVYSISIRAVGGLPTGSSGTVLCLLSSGLDSPVAAWQMMRRGAQVIGLHFSGAPESPDSSSLLVRQLAQKLAVTGGLRKLVFVHFGGYQRTLSLAIPESLRIIFYRRLMFKVAEQVATALGAKALVTGESLGQVASQTLDNIVAVDAVVSLPVFRPLIGTDKQEIIDRARELGTYAVSSQTTDDCCTLFMPRNPETHARLDDVESLWARLPISVWVDEIKEKLIIEEL
ncbi:MAG: tRNA 4-thiouridine(8) synthase ThiI [Coriobacteriales bacterium]|jgi:thiamine biosynthesis protein ThiI|nr:tRNA 4-thiouridine(8) synthase ThiI [Coriobacteriales bacterium]